jgi:hypothetical protein
MYKNRTIKSAEIVLRRGKRIKRRKMKRANLIQIYCSAIVNSTMYPLYNYNMLIGKE